MAIITISRGCYSHGRELAEIVAERLGYQCLSREIIIDATEYFHVSEKELQKSLDDPPGFFNRFTHGREEYLSYLQAALLEKARYNNIVYHGHGGHLLLPNIAHVLKVRVIADMKSRIAFRVEKEGLTTAKAREEIMKEDARRKEWTKTLFGKNIVDPSLYDLFINIGAIRLEDASDIIVNLARSPSFQATEESERAISDLAIECHIRASIYPLCKAKISVDDGNVKILIPSRRIKRTDPATPDLMRKLVEREKENLTIQISDIASKISGVQNVVCEYDSPVYY